jgi:hypothetical protein
VFQKGFRGVSEVFRGKFEEGLEKWLSFVIAYSDFLASLALVGG